jgi:hypothetical protein
VEVIHLLFATMLI